MDKDLVADTLAAERLGGKRAERREREAENVAIVRRAKAAHGQRTINGE